MIVASRSVIVCMRNYITSLKKEGNNSYHLIIATADPRHIAVSLSLRAV